MEIATLIVKPKGRATYCGSKEGTRASKVIPVAGAVGRRIRNTEEVDNIQILDIIAAWDITECVPEFRKLQFLISIITYSSSQKTKYISNVESASYTESF